jgi:hypothetical protein
MYIVHRYCVINGYISKLEFRNTALFIFLLNLIADPILFNSFKTFWQPSAFGINLPIGKNSQNESDKTRVHNLCW